MSTRFTASRTHTRNRILSGACAASVGAAVLASAPVPALALVSEHFADDSTAARAVVSEQIGENGDKDGNCTGTAVADHWVLTAHHCVDNADKPGGSVRIGQGDDQRRVDIDDWQTSPAGDFALIHTKQSMDLGAYPELSDEVKGDGKIEAYGWSSDGSGKTTKLPVGHGELKGTNDFALYEGKQAVLARLTDGSQFQPGDSGGPVFEDGKLFGVLSAAFDPDNPDSQTSPEAILAPTAEVADWVKQTIEKEPEPAQASDTEAHDAADKDSQSVPSALWWGLGGIGALALIGWATARARRTGAGADAAAGADADTASGANAEPVKGK